MSWEDSSEPQRANTKENQERASEGLASSRPGGSVQLESSSGGQKARQTRAEATRHQLNQG